MIPVTWGRTSAIIVGAVRPGKSVLITTLCGFTVMTVTCGGAFSAGGALARSHAAVRARVRRRGSRSTSDRHMAGMLTGGQRALRAEGRRARGMQRELV